jgi:hypothetical protein
VRAVLRMPTTRAVRPDGDRRSMWRMKLLVQPVYRRV